MGVTIASSLLLLQQVCTPRASIMLYFFILLTDTPLPYPRLLPYNAKQTVLNSCYFAEGIHQSVCRTVQKQACSNQTSSRFLFFQWRWKDKYLVIRRKKRMDALCCHSEGERQMLWGLSHSFPLPAKLLCCSVCDNVCAFLILSCFQFWTQYSRITGD